MLKIDQETCLSFTHYKKNIFFKVAQQLFSIILVCSLYILSGLDSGYSREGFFESLIFRALPKHYEDPVLTKQCTVVSFLALFESFHKKLRGFFGARSRINVSV